MSDLTTARKVVAKSLRCLADYVDKCNNGPAPVLLPTVTPPTLRTAADELDKVNNPTYLADLIKSDFKECYADHGQIEFKTLAALVEKNPKYLVSQSPPEGYAARKLKPLVLFTWPPDNSPNWGWGTKLVLDWCSLTLKYDFRDPDYYTFTLIDVAIAVEMQRPQTQGGPLQPFYTTPPAKMTVEIRIPKHINLSLPDITFDFFGSGFKLSLNVNFDWLSFSFSPLHFSFPSWLGLSLGPWDFGNFLKLAGDCDWAIALGLFDGWKGLNLKWPWDWGKLKGILLKLFALLGFEWPGGSLNLQYFTQVVPADSGFFPKWAAVYLNLNFLQKVMGGFMPKELHLLLGVTGDKQLKAGFLMLTGKLFEPKALMLQTALQYDFEFGEGASAGIEAHPGGILEILSDANAKALAVSQGWPELAEPKISFGSFSASLDRVAYVWDKDEKSYVCLVDGQFTIDKLLKSADPNKPNAALELPFKGLGATTDGRLVLKKNWPPLKEAMQVKLDGIDQVGLFVSGYGYEKTGSGPFWIGFSGDVSLPVLGVKAGVERLVFKSNGEVELSGVRIDTKIAETLTLQGSLKWGAVLAPPCLPGETVDGFAGLLRLGLPAPTLDVMMGMTYVRYKKSGVDLIAWSFAGDVTLPAPIPICCAVGISSLGLLLGQNYMPKPKVDSLPYDRWLEQGFDNDVINIMNFVDYWRVRESAFAAGFSIGLATIADQGFILRSKAILVLVIPGPLVMIAGKADVLRAPKGPIAGIFNLLVIYDQADPGIMISLSFRYEIEYLLTVKGMAEIYFDFDDVSRWHFYLGTPEKRISARLLSIFEASSYLVIDAFHFAQGAAVYLGWSWSAGPLSARAYITFSEEIAIGWNPVFVRCRIELAGELGVRIFGFGLSARLKAALEVKAATPWFLYAMAELGFTIDLWLFSISFTVHVELSWGTNDGTPPAVLGPLHDDAKVFKPLASALRSYTSLAPDSEPATRYLPMDGVLALEFNRDVEIISEKGKTLELSGPTSQTVVDEESPDADNFKKFHGRLADLQIEYSSGAGPKKPLAKPVYFIWTPVEEADRNRLRVREHDRGFSQFRLNDDPNSVVKLVCPDLFSCATPLLFDVGDPDLQPGGFAVPDRLVFEAVMYEMSVQVPQKAGNPPDYTLDYCSMACYLAINGVIPLEAGVGWHAIRVELGMELELDLPSACIAMAIAPEPFPAAGAVPQVADLVSLYDETGLDVTDICVSQVFLPPGVADRFTLVLNDFEPAKTANAARTFAGQKPPTTGVKKVVFRQTGKVYRSPSGYLTLFPMQALREINERNLERVRQQAHLEYDLEQNTDPGRILWDVGDYEASGRTVWWVDQSREESSVGIPLQRFTVIPPFENNTVNEVPVHPYEPYVRRFTPREGARPVYGDQYPEVVYRCNTINQMLLKGSRRLGMLLFDSDNNPCRYKRIIVSSSQVEPALAQEYFDFARNLSLKAPRDLKEVDEMLAEAAPGLSLADLEAAAGSAWSTHVSNSLNASGGSAEPVRIGNASRRTVAEETARLRRERLGQGDRERSKRARQLEKMLAAELENEADSAVFFNVGGEVIAFKLHIVEGLVEYRYTNDDLALDASSLQLDACLQAGRPIRLNAYERGYFAPVVPAGAIWEGPRPNTRYTARIYALDSAAALDNQALDKLAELYKLGFATSLFGSPAELAAHVQAPKTAEVVVTPDIYRQVIGSMTPDSAVVPFDHPDKSGLKLDVGLDLFRQLQGGQAITAQDAKVMTGRELEESFYKRLEAGRTALEAARQAEGLGFEEAFDTMGVNPDALMPPGARVTWLRTGGKNGEPVGTLGLLIDFPEPVDWERTGLRIESFVVRRAGSDQDLDLVNLAGSDPAYRLTLHRLRSLDGARLLLVPHLTETRVSPPDIVLSVLGLSALQPAAGAAAVAGPLVRRRRGSLADYAFASNVGLTNSMAGVSSLFGTASTDISDYQVCGLELGLYYLSDNYEGNNDNYRPIPRLHFRHGAPGDAYGKIGTLVAAKTVPVKARKTGTLAATKRGNVVVRKAGALRKRKGGK